MVLLSVREIHDVKTLNSELRSNSQLSACILYGTLGLRVLDELMVYSKSLELKESKHMRPPGWKTL